MAKSKTSTCQPPIPSRFPWLVYSHGKRSNTQTFYDIEGGNCNIKKIPDMSNKCICTSSHGWMVMMDLDLKVDVCFLLNPVSMEKIMLPPLKPIRWKYCILSLPPSDPTCIVAFFYSDRPYVLFCHPGEKLWREQEFDIDTRLFQDIVSCEGKIYCLNSSPYNLMEIMVLDNHQLEMRQLGVEKFEQMHLPGELRRGCFLIESLGEIFLVIIMVCSAFESKIRDICVYKMDLKKLKWIRVNDLGDHRVFFLSGITSVSCSSIGSSGHVRENSIYFTLFEEVKTSMYVYCMKEKTITTCLVCPNVVHNVTRGQWIMPNL